MKSKFGPGGNSQSFFAEGKKSTLDAPEWLAKRGLDAYEYQGGRGLFGSAATLNGLRDKAAEYGIKMSLHAPYYISLSSVEEDLRIKSVGHILHSARFADALGADIFVVHSGSCAKLDRRDAMNFSLQTLEKAAMRLDETGAVALLGIETMGKQNQLGTLDEVLEQCRVDLKRFRPVVDFGHINARTNGGLKNEDDFKRIFYKIAELDAGFAEHLHCHFSKIEYTKMGEKKHLTFADTEYGPCFEPMARAIVSLGVAPTIICESDGTMAEDAAAMRDILQGMGVNDGD